MVTIYIATYQSLLCLCVWCNIASITVCVCVCVCVCVLGQQYDKNGNRVKWWTDASIADFKKRTQCFVDQYNKYEQQGVKVGTKTMLTGMYDNAKVQFHTRSCT